jgi:hypothetical protein
MMQLHSLAQSLDCPWLLNVPAQYCSAQQALLFNRPQALIPFTCPQTDQSFSVRLRNIEKEGLRPSQRNVQGNNVQVSTKTVSQELQMNGSIAQKVFVKVPFVTGSPSCVP